MVNRQVIYRRTLTYQFEWLICQTELHLDYVNCLQPLQTVVHYTRGEDDDISKLTTTVSTLFLRGQNQEYTLSGSPEVNSSETSDGVRSQALLTPPHLKHSKASEAVTLLSTLYRGSSKHSRGDRYLHILYKTYNNRSI